METVLNPNFLRTFTSPPDSDAISGLLPGEVLDHQLSWRDTYARVIELYPYYHQELRMELLIKLEGIAAGKISFPGRQAILNVGHCYMTHRGEDRFSVYLATAELEGEPED